MKTRQRRRSAWMLGGAGIVATALFAACNLDASGVLPPEGAFAYPVAVALSREPTPRTLFVANSNFDLTYSAGSVQAYDLTVLDQQFEACRQVNATKVASDASVEVPDNTTRLDGGAAVPDGGLDGGIDGGLDGGIDAGLDGGVPSDASVEPAEDGQVADAAPFDASDGAVDAAPAPPNTILLPADYAPAGLGPFPEGAVCDDEKSAPDGGFERAGCCLRTGVDQLGRDTLDRARIDEKSIDSFATGLAVSPDNRRLYVPISSRSRLVYLDIESTGALSCGSDTGRCTRGPGQGRSDDDPEESYPGQPSAVAVGTLSDLGITEQELGKPAQTPIVITAHETGGLSLYVESGPLGESGLELASEPVLESVQDNEIVAPTSATIDPRNQLVYVTRAGRSPFIQRFGVRVDTDTTDDPREPQRREMLYLTSPITLSGIAEGDDLRDVALDPQDPTRLFAMTRGAPQSVLFFRLDPTFSLEARVTEAVRVGTGPAKLKYAVVDGRAFLFASNYEERAIYVIDATTVRVAAIVRNLSGPYDMAVDTARRLVYVADFRTSVLRVVDIAGLVDRNKPPPGIIATIGAQKFKGTLQ